MTMPFKNFGFVSLMHNKLLIIWFLGVQQVMAIEEPKYTLLEQQNDFELREYKPYIVAETTVNGSMDDASSAGFKKIADYIFGNNTVQTKQPTQPLENNEPTKGDAGKSSKIAMTAPVTVTANTKNNTKIAMTAPVNIKKTQSNNNSKNQWVVHFVMPSQYTMQTIPLPNNTEVTLRKVPTHKVAVIRFSGFTGKEKVAKKTQDLLDWLNQKGLQPMGEPSLARYNPPWSLPFLRRNEVMISIR